MKKVILLFLLNLSTFAVESEMDYLWSIKVNLQLFSRSQTTVAKEVQRDFSSRAICYKIGLLEESYQLKRAFTNVYSLKKVNPNLGKSLFQLLNNYIEKDLKLLQRYCLKQDISIIDLQITLSSIRGHLLKAETIITSRMNDINN